MKSEINLHKWCSFFCDRISAGCRLLRRATAEELRISCQFRTPESKAQISRGIFTNFLIWFPTFVINQATINLTFHCFFFLKHDTSRWRRMSIKNWKNWHQENPVISGSPKSSKIIRTEANEREDGHGTYMHTEYYFQREWTPVPDSLTRNAAIGTPAGRCAEQGSSFTDFYTCSCLVAKGKTLKSKLKIHLRPH